MSTRDAFPLQALNVTLRIEPLDDDGTTRDALERLDHNELSWRVSQAVLEALELPADSGAVVVTAKVARALQ